MEHQTPAVDANTIEYTPETRWYMCFDGNPTANERVFDTLRQRAVDTNERLGVLCGDGEHRDLLEVSGILSTAQLRTTLTALKHMNLPSVMYFMQRGDAPPQRFRLFDHDVQARVRRRIIQRALEEQRRKAK